MELGAQTAWLQRLRGDPTSRASESFQLVRAGTKPRGLGRQERVQGSDTGQRRRLDFGR